jgi:hypothetical protein
MMGELRSHRGEAIMLMDRRAFIKNSAAAEPLQLWVIGFQA